MVYQIIEERKRETTKNQKNYILHKYRKALI